MPNRKPNKLYIAVGNNLPDLFRLQRISDKMTKQAEHGNKNTLQASNPLWVKPGWGELTPVYYCCFDLWPLSPASVLAVLPPTKQQTELVYLQGWPLTDAADVLHSGCLIRVAPFRGTQGCRWDKEEKLKIAFILFFSLRHAEGEKEEIVFFLCCCSLQVNGGRFNINSLGLVFNQCSLTFVTFSDVILPSSCLTFI